MVGRMTKRTLSTADRVAAQVAALPANVRVGPFDFRLEPWDTAAARAHACYGECSHTELRISFDAAMTDPVVLLDTIMHELTHAIFFVYDIKDEDAEERTVRLMATGWVQIYRDNPALLKWTANAF